MNDLDAAITELEEYLSKRLFLPDNWLEKINWACVYHIMSPEEFEKVSIFLKESIVCKEYFHIYMDKLMKNLLENLGYSNGVKIIDSTENCMLKFT